MNSLQRADDGGEGYESWRDVDAPPLPAGDDILFYPPLATTPPSPPAPGDANLVAIGSRRPWICGHSRRSRESCPSIPDNAEGDMLPDPISALAFASGSILYAGTTGGEVYRYTRMDDWRRARAQKISSGVAGPLGLTGAWISSIAVIPADPSGASIYASFAGIGDHPHAWRLPLRGAGRR